MKRLLPIAAATVFCIIVGSVFAGQPRYSAQADFSIDWNKMPAEGKNPSPDKAQQSFDHSLVNIEISDQYVSLLCSRCNIPGTESGSILKMLRQELKVVKIADSNNCALYQVQIVGDDRRLALEAVKLFSHRFVDAINLKAKFWCVKDTVAAYKENANCRKNGRELGDELANLLQQQKEDYSLERAAKIIEIQAEQKVNDLNKAASQVQMLAGVVEAVSTPAKIEQKAVVSDLN